MTEPFDPASERVRIAPAFDFGSCLLPQADDDIMRRVIEDKAECDARIYTFPASALKQGGKKINYVDFVRQASDGVLAPSRAHIVPKIDLGAIDAFISGVLLNSELQRSFFYKYYLAARCKAMFQVRIGKSYNICARKNRGDMYLTLLSLDKDLVNDWKPQRGRASGDVRPYGQSMANEAFSRFDLTQPYMQGDIFNVPLCKKKKKK